MRIATSLDDAIFDKDTAVALGFFDGVHLGHREVIEAAVSYPGGKFAPCVFTFVSRRETPAGKKGNKRLISDQDKYALLGELGVQYVAAPDFCEFMGLSPEEFISEVLAQKLHAKAVCCGDNFRFGKNAAGDVALLERLCPKYGIDVQVCPPVVLEGAPVSSTRIRECVRQGDMVLAAKLLGRLYSFCSEVVDGRRLGRKLNFPTINQLFPDMFELPRFGVYAAFAHVGEQVLPAVTNIGLRPTVGSDKPLAETYIMDYNGDLYGHNIRVSLLRFMRPELKFDSVEELRGQIASDVLDARRICADFGGTGLWRG